MSLRFWLTIIALVLFAVAVAMLSMAPDPTFWAKETVRAPERGSVVGERVGARLEAGPSPAAPATGTAGAVRGRVVDDEGMPVDEGALSLRCLDEDGAVHHVANGTVSLGPDGTFEIPACLGRVCIELSHPTLVRDHAWVTTSDTVVELRARAAERMEGTVFGPEGEPVSAARVMVVPAPGEVDPRALPPFVSTNTSTDGDGRFSLTRIERPPCDVCDDSLDRCRTSDDDRLWDAFLVIARFPGLTDAQQRIDLPATGEALPMIELRLEPSRAAIRGTVAAGDSRGTYVLARSLERRHELHRADVHDDQFEIAGIGRGPYELRVIRDGRELARMTGVEAGAQVRMGGEIPREPADSPL